MTGLDWGTNHIRGHPFKSLCKGYHSSQQQQHYGFGPGGVNPPRGSTRLSGRGGANPPAAPAISAIGFSKKSILGAGTSRNR